MTSFSSSTPSLMRPALLLVALCLAPALGESDTEKLVETEASVVRANDTEIVHGDMAVQYKLPAGARYCSPMGGRCKTEDDCCVVQWPGHYEQLACNRSTGKCMPHVYNV